jgi:hypothetical protein
MGRRRTHGTDARPGDALDAESAPIPLDPIGLLAGIAPGLELDGTVSPDGDIEPAPISVEEVGRLLRCNEATVRRLIRTAVLRPVGMGERFVRRRDLDDYWQSLHRRPAGKPGE